MSLSIKNQNELVYILILTRQPDNLTTIFINAKRPSLQTAFSNIL